MRIDGLNIPDGMLKLAAILFSHVALVCFPVYLGIEIVVGITHRK